MSAVNLNMLKNVLDSCPVFLFILTCIICFSENGELLWKKVDIGKWHFLTSFSVNWIVLVSCKLKITYMTHIPKGPPPPVWVWIWDRPSLALGTRFLTLIEKGARVWTSSTVDQYLSSWAKARSRFTHIMANISSTVSTAQAEFPELIWLIIYNYC